MTDNYHCSKSIIYFRSEKQKLSKLSFSCYDLIEIHWLLYSIGINTISFEFC
jgi:hypothetical protein